MKLRTYWAIMEPPTLVILAVLGLGGSVMFHLFAPLASHRTGAMAFVVLTLLGPYFAGCIISHTLHAPLHRPFSITLPNVRRNFLQWHLPTLGIVALLLASAAGKYDHGLPRPVAASVAFAGLCLMLPFETGLRWYGSTKLLVAIMGSMLLAAMWANETRAILLYLPWLTVTGSLALAALCCRLTFARNRLRNRARIPVLSIGESPTAEAEERQTMADTPRLGRSWTHGAIGDSTFSWIRAILHETYGYRSRLAVPLVIVPLLYMAVFPVAAYYSQNHGTMSSPKVPLGQFIYQVIWEHEPFGVHHGGLQQLLLFPLLFSLSLASALPRPQQLYPISRERRARLTFILTLLQVGVQLLTALACVLVLSWIAAWLAGWPFQPNTVPDFAVIVIALSPFIPAIFWVRQYAQVRSQKTPLIETIFWIGSVTLAVIFSNAWRTWLLSPAGLASAALAMAASLCAYRVALFYFYRRGDLLQRRSSR